VLGHARVATVARAAALVSTRSTKSCFARAHSSRPCPPIAVTTIVFRASRQEKRNTFFLSRDRFAKGKPNGKPGTRGAGNGGETGDVEKLGGVGECRERRGIAGGICGDSRGLRSDPKPHTGRSFFPPKSSTPYPKTSRSCSRQTQNPTHP
jgi:hypothetical protein